MDQAECFCCSNGHKHPVTGEVLRCDRRAIEKCINRWFESKSNFDYLVRTTFLRKIRDTMLHSQLPYAWVLLASLPMQLAFMDKAENRLVLRNVPGACAFLAYGGILHVVIFPVGFKWIASLSTWRLAVARNFAIEVLKSVVLSGIWNLAYAVTWSVTWHLPVNVLRLQPVVQVFWFGTCCLACLVMDGVLCWFRRDSGRTSLRQR